MTRYSLVTTLLLAVGLAACNKGQDQAAQNPTAVPASDVSSGNPADGNLAPVSQYNNAPQQAVPAAPASGQSYAPPPPGYAQSGSDYGYDSSDQQPIEASAPPPPLPDYQQPPAPGDDYMWTPGYWDYADSGYYWVPGAWVLAPYVGALWTPPWWGYDNGHYFRHAGYWAPHIGYYGDIDYGYGYTGRGYYGAYWDRGHLDYNRAVTNVDRSRVQNVYDYHVAHDRGDRVSYNGGRGGVSAQPTPQEMAVTRGQRVAPVQAQVEHAHQASSNRAQFAQANGGRPTTLAAPSPIATNYHAPASRPPAGVIRAQQRPTPATPAPAPAQANRPGLQATRGPENRPAPQILRRPQQESPAQNQARPEFRPNPTPQGRQAVTRPVVPQQRAEPQSRPAPAQSRVEPRPQPHNATPQPQQQARPEVRQVAPQRPAQSRVERAQPQPAAPQARPQPRPAPAQSRAEPRPQPRPVAPQARPEPQRGQAQAHIEQRPQARPEARPAPAARPEPQARPEPHPAPAPRAQPQQKDEHKKP